jgi:hypothetical protein
MKKNERGQSAVEVSLALLLAAGLLLWISLTPAAMQAGEAVAEAIGQLTSHATGGHLMQAWNATNISEYMSSGGCMPKMYVCEADDIEVYYCEMNRGKSIGLIVGHTVRQVITGLMAKTSWWERRCK